MSTDSMDMSLSKLPEMVNDQELGEKHGTVSLTALRSNQSCQWQDLKPLEYRNQRQYISVILNHPVVCTLLQQRQETHTNQIGMAYEQLN